MTTREKILEVSLDMFAKQGYTAVSIRDICKKVGIKESSVYYHFKNKQWLLDKPLQIQSKIFQTLMNFDIIPNCDSQYLAIKYYSPIYFYANKWLFSEELTEENKIAFREAAYKHIQIFFTEMGENK